jgi:hypothetical protein
VKLDNILTDFAHNESTQKGISGFVASIFLAMPAWMDNIEWLLKIVSLLCSIGVAVMTMVMLYRKHFKKK